MSHIMRECREQQREELESREGRLQARHSHESEGCVHHVAAVAEVVISVGLNVSARDLAHEQGEHISGNAEVFEAILHGEDVSNDLHEFLAVVV